MEKLSLTPFVVVLFSLATLLASALISWGVTKATIRFNREKIKELNDAISALSTRLQNALYGTDGVTIYTPRKICEMMRQECEENFTDKVEELKVTMKDNKQEITQKLDRSLEMVNNQYVSLMQFVGRVEEFMKNSDKKGA